jgi:hypothetical protein
MAGQNILGSNAGVIVLMRPRCVSQEQPIACVGGVHLRVSAFRQCRPNSRVERFSAHLSLDQDLSAAH